MSLKTIFEFLVSDVLTASAISLFFTWSANKHADENEKQNDENLQELKDHIDLRLEIIEQKLENVIIKNKT